MDFNNVKYFQIQNKYVIKVEDENRVLWLYQAPTLAPSNSWYKGSLTRNTITSISIVENYLPTGEEDESWNADENDNGDITAYLIGTDLIISVQGGPYFYANPDSSFAFGGNSSTTRWSKVTSFTGLNRLLTNKVVSMKRMFDGLFLLENIDVGHFITNECTTMECMFNNCELLKEIDVSKWDVSKVTNMYAMFADCTKITKLDTKNWNPISCLNANSLCYDCFELKEIDLSNADWAAATNIGMSFYCCYDLPTVKLKRSNGKSTNAVWQAPLCECTSLVTYDASDIHTQGISDLSYFFEECTNLKEVIWHGLDLSSCTSWYNFFSGCTSLEKVDFSGINTAAIGNNRNQNVIPTSNENVDIFVNSEEEKTFVERHLAYGATNVTYHINEI